MGRGDGADDGKTESVAFRVDRDQTSDGPAREDHGRAVTANQPAAAWYRGAQRAVDRHRAIVALRLAVAADPAFELALVDLGAISGTPAVAPGRGQMNWERHHIEVVRLATAGYANGLPTLCASTSLVSAATLWLIALQRNPDTRRRRTARTASPTSFLVVCPHFGTAARTGGLIKSGHAIPL